MIDVVLRVDSSIHYVFSLVLVSASHFVHCIPLCWHPNGTHPSSPVRHTEPHLVGQPLALRLLTLALQLARLSKPFFGVVVYQSRFTFNNHLLNLYPLDSEAS